MSSSENLREKDEGTLDVHPCISSSGNIYKAILKVSLLTNAKKKKKKWIETRRRRRERREILTLSRNKTRTKECMKAQTKNSENKRKKIRTLKLRESNLETIYMLR